MSESGREYARRLRGAEMAKEQRVCTERLEAAITGAPGEPRAILTTNVLRWPAEERIAFARHLLGSEWKSPEHERLEAQLVEVNGALTEAIRRHDALSAEHTRVCNEHALLVQESGREGRELDRLEGLLRAWGTEAPDAETYHRREEAVYAEAEKLAKEKA